MITVLMWTRSLCALCESTARTLPDPWRELDSDRGRLRAETPEKRHPFP